jgi:hypothetical protein
MTAAITIALTAMSAMQTDSNGDNSPIVSLSSKVQDLGESFSLWNRISLGLVAATAIVAALYFIASYITAKKGERLSDAQAVLLRAKEEESRLQIGSLQRDTAQARRDAERARKESADASAQIADAHARSAEASRLAEDAKKEAAAYAARIAEAEARAAEAKRRSEEDRLARVKIEQAMAYRQLSPPAQARVAAKLRAFPGQKIEVHTQSQEPEIKRLLDQIFGAVVGPEGGGWSVVLNSIDMGAAYSVVGIVVAVHPKATQGATGAAAVLVASLAAEGLSIQRTNGTVPGLTPQDPSNIAIAIGTRPGM